MSESKTKSSSSVYHDSIYEEYEMQPLVGRVPRQSNSDRQLRNSLRDSDSSSQNTNINDFEEANSSLSSVSHGGSSESMTKESRQQALNNKQSLNTQLLKAVATSNFTEVERLLNEGASANATCPKSFYYTSSCHFAAMVDNKILSLLLGRGADKHKIDDKGRTPLHLAASVGNLNNLGLLLGLPQELQNKLNHEKTMTEDLIKELMVLQPVLKELVNIRCVNMSKENKQVSVPEADRGSGISDDCFEFRKFFKTPSFSSERTPLHVASSMGHPHAVRFLLAAGADPCLRDKYEETPLAVACTLDSEQKIMEIVQILLPLSLKGTEIENEKDLGIVLCNAVMSEKLDCVEMLLKFGASPNTYDQDKSWTALHHAMYICNRDIIMLLLQNGADLSAVAYNRYDTRTAIQMLMDYMLKPTEFVKEIFDTCISTEPQDIRDNDTRKYNYLIIHTEYNILVPTKPKSQETPECANMRVIQALINTGNRHDQKRLLIHPLVESFICLCWENRISRFFFFTMLILFGLFTISLTFYISSEFYNKEYETDDKMQNKTHVKTKEMLILLNAEAWKIAVYLFCSLTVFMEIAFYQNFSKQYILRFEFLIKSISLIFGVILPSIINTPSTGFDWPRHLATMALLLSWTEMTLLMSRVFTWDYYVQMFGTVSYKVLKILVTFSFLVFGFALCFMIQFHYEDQFVNPWTALVKIMAMMTSEFDYDDLVKYNTSVELSGKTDELEKSLFIIRILFLIFLIFVSIVLMNLMIGVAVDDLRGLELGGKVMRLEKQVEFLSLLETNFIFKKFIQNKIIKNQLPKYIEISTKNLACIDDPFSDKRIPSEIKKTIYDVALSNVTKKSEIETKKVKDKKKSEDNLRKVNLNITEMKKKIDILNQKIDLLTSQFSEQPTRMM